VSRINRRRFRVGVLATHPIQYYAPWYRGLAEHCELEVFFAHRQNAGDQAAAGFGVKFDWDVPLLDGYASRFLRNSARTPDVSRFWGCVTPEVRDVIRERQFDAFIVQGWSTASYWQAIRACWRSRTPVLVRGDSNLVTPRARWRRSVKWPVYRAFVPRFDGYLVVGTRAREYLLHYGADPARCFDAPHCVDNEFFASRSDPLRCDRAATRARFGLAPEDVVFLFAGRFIERKEPLMFVRALSSAASGATGIAGLMVGDGPLRNAAQSLAARVSAPIRFAGFLNQTEMASAYAACDALVVPSTWETWGLIVNEAMACGVPAIVTAGVACAGDLVVPGVTGEVCPVGAIDAFAGCIGRLAHDAAYRTTLSTSARRHVARFDVTAAAAGTLRAVEHVARQRSGGALPAAALNTPSVGRR
jgi:glycosyltransferase involved in cell wall biosynthesis